MFFQNTAMTIIATTIGIAVDAWRFRQFLSLPSEREVHKVGLILSIIIAVVFAALVTKWPEAFGFLIEHTYHNYQMIVKLTGDQFRAKSVFFIETAVFTFGFFFPYAQLLAHERGDFINSKNKAGPPILLAAFLLCCALYLGTMILQVEEPNPRRNYMYVPHRNLGQFFVFMACFVIWSFMPRYLLGSYRDVQVKRLSIRLIKT